MIYNVSNLNASKIVIGRRGENLANTIEIDVSAWLAEWPSAGLSVVVMRPGDTVPYVAGTSVRDGVLSWPVTNVDTENAGKGKIEVRASSGDVMKKSVIATIEIEPCILCDEDADPPELDPALVDQAIAAAERAEKAVQRAENGLDWEGIANKPDTYRPTSHTHAQSDIVGLENALSGKANDTHTHAQSDIVGLENALAKRDRVVNLLDNSHFPEAINQRNKTTTTAWGYCLDRWTARSTGIGLATDGNGLHITCDATANVYLYQKIKIPSAQMLGNTYTVAICDGDGNIACKTVTLPTAEPTTWKTIDSAYAGNVYVSVIHTGSGENGFCVSIGRTASSTDEVIIRWVALYEGSYTLDTLPTYQPKGYGAEIVECQRYYHVYATAAARPAHGLDCSPPMRLNTPTQGTISINDTTYYYNAADL